MNNIFPELREKLYRSTALVKCPLCNVLWLEASKAGNENIGSFHQYLEFFFQFLHFYLFFSIQNSYVIISSGLVNQKWRNVFFWEKKGPRAGRQGGEDGVHAEGHLGLCGQLRQLHPLRSQASTQSGEHQLKDQPEPAESPSESWWRTPEELPDERC